MTANKIESFGGEIPAVDERLLPTNAAAKALNTWLLSGRIEPLRSLVHLTELTDFTWAWFRLPNGNPGIDDMGDSTWMQLPHPATRVIRSPVAGQDDDGRYYWAAPNDVPRYNTGERIRLVQFPLRLGVPSPGTAPVVGVEGGTGSPPVTTRSYCYTWVTLLGEEGAPSRPSEPLSGFANANWGINLTGPTTDEQFERLLQYTRIYRTVTSAQGIATFFFVAEIDIGQVAYTDTISDAEIVFNEQLESLYWTEPPTDLQGLVSMPNGMVAGWRKDEVWFCEPYHPHAWPEHHTIAVDAEIVGLGVYNQSLIILTNGQPYSATGVDPNSMALAKVQPIEICTSQRSIVSTPTGVLYTSPNGLINITPAGAVNLTKDMIIKDQWNALFNLPSVTAAVVMNGYYAYSTVTSQKGVYIPLDGKAGMVSLLPDPQIARNIIVDIFNGETMISRDGIVYVIDVRKSEPYNAYRWRSKLFVADYLDNMAAAKIYWEPAVTSDLVPAKTVFRFFAGRQTDLENGGALPMRYERELKPSGEMYRLPSGYKAMYYQLEVEGAARIISIHVASSARELRAI